MISPRWRKVLQDLWFNRTRTILVILSIAVGVFALGTVEGSRTIVMRDMRATYGRIHPQSAIVVTQPFDDELLESVRRMKQVGEADGRSYVSVRVEVAPGEWKTLQLAAMRDFKDIRVNKVFPVSGDWPPARKEMLIERRSLSFLKAQVGDTIVVETPDKKQRALRISGTTHEINVFPVDFSGTPYGYISLDTLEWLGQPRGLTQINFAVAQKPLDKNHIQSVADQVRDQVRASGREVFYIWVPPPGKYVPDDQIQALMLLLAAMGTFSLLLSGFLVINTISAVLTEQLRQIGIMKAIGARRSQLLAMYLTLVGAYAVLSLAVAVPLGALGAWGLTRYLAGVINFDVSSWAVPRSVLLIEVAAGLLVPLLTAVMPVIGGTRITVREAVSDYGMGQGAARLGRVDRLMYRVRKLPRPMLLSLRNTFRRKGRLVRTLATLVLGGAIFMAVVSMRESVLLTVEDAMGYFNYDISVTMSRPQPFTALRQIALQVPGVTEAHRWTWRGAAVKRPDGGVSEDYQFLALEPGSEIVKPTVLQGRWLLPEDENAVVVNTNIVKDEENIRVGEDITLKIEGRETQWQVVGVVRSAMDVKGIYANYPYFAAATSDLGRTSTVLVRTAGHDPATHALLAKALKEQFEAEGMKVTSTESATQIRERIHLQFNILIVLLLIISVLMAVVGGLGLMGTMSINVLERTREIGVMRAIGAGNGAVIQVIMAEGILIGLVSWAVGAVLAVPMSQILSYSIGMAFLRAPMLYAFSVWGTVLWLVLVLILAALASILPAWRASRLSVREVLAYE